MADLLEQEISGEPVAVVLGGKSYPLVFGMAAAIVYKAQTARIERSRPRSPDPDPKCLCGAPRSQHEGPDLIILDEEKRLLCWHFRLYDPSQGDSLFSRESWARIDLDVDPERWHACLWAGLHSLQNDAWKAPMTLAQLGMMIPIGPAARDLSTKIVLALKQASPKPVPNAAAPAAEDATPAQSPNSKSPNPISTGSTPELVADSASPVASS